MTRRDLTEARRARLGLPPGSQILLLARHLHFSVYTFTRDSIEIAIRDSNPKRKAKNERRRIDRVRAAGSTFARPKTHFGATARRARSIVLLTLARGNTEVGARIRARYIPADFHRSICCTYTHTHIYRLFPSPPFCELFLIQRSAYLTRMYECRSIYT